MTQYLETPREPLRPVVDSPWALQACLTALADGEGPVAFDAERAHGHRYWPKAYLFQIRRNGAGTWLIDPIAFEQSGPAELGCLVAACGDATWLVHAASQDLPCMAEVGIRPPRLFDTELAGRLLGEAATGLASMLDSKLNITLRKAHSAANWSSRPLPTAWLIYAALDVDYLAELAEVLRDELLQMDRLEWARQEFDHVLKTYSTAPAPRPDPWRRLSGLTNLRRSNQLAVARELWLERDAIARAKDRPPGRILPDAAIVDLAATVAKEGPMPGPEALNAVPDFRTRGAQRYRSNWIRALARVATATPAQYPPKGLPSNGIPQPRTWKRQYPEAWARWQCVRAAVDALATELGLQTSLLAPSGLLQTWIFQHQPGHDPADELRALGVRPWQRDLLAPRLGNCARVL